MTSPFLSGWDLFSSGMQRPGHIVPLLLWLPFPGSFTLPSGAHGWASTSSLVDREALALQISLSFRTYAPMDDISLNAFSIIERLSCRTFIASFVIGSLPHVFWGKLELGTRMGPIWE